MLTFNWPSVVYSSPDPDQHLESFRPYDSFVELKGGEFQMGINDRSGVNHEYPARHAKVAPFRIHLYPVTIASFKNYKKEKFRHRTDAELARASWVFEKLVDEHAQIDPVPLDESRHNKDVLESQASWHMVRVHDARWNKPEGGTSLINHRFSHPVTHVSYNDAFAYCTWKNMRLPTEIEWEYAARGGLSEKLYPWGDHWEVGRTNLWQGHFPDENQMRDENYGLAPVDAYSAQNEFGMYDVIGNVWEWTSTV
jgi:formylglycine-generating enzyme required for sulfatase activity